jgi:ribosomal protein S18 acetylase RimI-like enzyme
MTASRVCLEERPALGRHRLALVPAPDSLNHWSHIDWPVSYPSMHIRTVNSCDGPLLKQMTLSSVEDSPYAFGGPETLSEEQLRPDTEWSDLAAECAGEVEAWRDRCVGYFAMDGETACGKALAFLSSKTPSHAHMSAVWVDPRFRRLGLGRMLVQEASRWAISKGADRLRLWVDDRNPQAAAFYRALGFVPTGKSRPVLPTSNKESEFEFLFPPG